MTRQTGDIYAEPGTNVVAPADGIVIHPNMKKYYLVRCEFRYELMETDEPCSAELQIYSDTPKEAVEICKKIFVLSWNFTVLEVKDVDHL